MKKRKSNRLLEIAVDDGGGGVQETINDGSDIVEFGFTATVFPSISLGT